jgi:hypothetical protein
LKKEELNMKAKTREAKKTNRDGRTKAGRLHRTRSEAAKRAWVTIRANREKAAA